LRWLYSDCGRTILDAELINVGNSFCGNASPKELPRSAQYKSLKKYPDCMIGQYFKDAIKIIRKRLDGNQIRWALVGSANMKLQGMKTEPRDLDIVVQYKDLQKVSGIFSDYSASAVKELESLTDKPAWEVKARINGAEVQFIAGDEKDVYVSKLLANKITYVKLDGVDIPCFTLEAESQAYAETNRGHKARLIQEFLGARNRV